MYYENPPLPGLFDSLGSTGHSMEQALEEIIDNSIFADAKNVWINFDKMDTPEFYISITDDGGGMDDPGIKSAMNMGIINSTTARDPKDLGRFGLGLKLSSRSQCRKFSVISKNKDSDFNGWTWDLDLVETEKKWIMTKFSTDTYPDSIDLIQSKSSGTVVLWENIDNEITKTDKSETKFRIWQRAAEHIGMTFGKIISGNPKVNIFLNGEPIEPWDPFYVGKSEVVTIENHPVNITGYVLPHTKDLGSETFNRLKGPKGWNAQQGFYLYRNKRLIISGEWFDLFQQEEHYKLARISIDIDNSEDTEEWGIDFKKTKVIPSEKYKNLLKTTAAKVRERATQVYRYRARKRTIVSQQQFHNIWNFKVDDRIPNLKINLNNEYIKLALKHDDTNLLRNVIKVLEEYVPLKELFIYHKSLEWANDPFNDNKTELRELLEKIIQSALIKNAPIQELKNNLKLNPPGSEYPEIIDGIFESLDMEYTDG